MGQTAFEMQAETCMSYLPFPQGIRCFGMPYCIVFLGVIEKSCQKLVLSSVSRCLEPLMKHSHSFLTYYLKNTEAFISILGYLGDRNAAAHSIDSDSSTCAFYDLQ